MNTVKVGDVCEQIRGVTYEKSEARETPMPGYSPIVRANNIDDHGLVFDSLVFVPDAKISAKQRVRVNDVIVAASSGSLSVVGKAAQARSSFNGGFGAFCKVLRPGPKVDPHYFGHYFRTPSYRSVVSQLAAGANINNLKNEHLDELRLRLPSLAEQKRIATILDTADELRAKRRDALAQLDNLQCSVFLQMFGDPVTNPKRWTEKPFGEIAIDTKLGLVRSSEEFGWEFTVPYVRMDALTSDGRFLPDKVQFTDASKDEVEAFALRPGDFLFNTRNSKELVGKVCVFPGPSGALFNNNLMRIRFSDDTEPTFISMQFRFGRIRSEIEKRKAGTTSVFAVYWKSLRTLPVLVPPPGLQRQFAKAVERIEQQRAANSAHLAELDRLFAALQSRAFKGDL